MQSKTDRKKQVWMKSNGICAHCGKTVSGELKTIDHVIPQIYDGGDDIRNLMPLCYKCNQDRASGSIVPQTYYKYVTDRAIKELLTYIDEWKMRHTNAAGEVITYDGRYGIDEVGMARYKEQQKLFRGGFYTASKYSIARNPDNTDNTDSPYKDASIFLHNACHIFAKALSEEFGYPLKVIKQKNGQGFYVFCFDGGLYIDVRGFTSSFKDFEKELDYRFTEEDVIEDYNGADEPDPDGLAFARWLIQTYRDFYSAPKRDKTMTAVGGEKQI